MTPKEQWEAARVLYEARTIAAWGKSHGAIIIARQPWQSHDQHPEVAEAHLLALAEIRGLLKHYDITKKDAL